MLAKPLTVVMPAFDEADGIEAAVTGVHQFLTARGYDLDLIVVDDASTDDTFARASALGQRLPGVRALRHPHNMGPCSGLATGGRVARHDWVLLLPVDIAIPLEDVDILWAARDRGDVVVGYLADGGARELRRRVQSRIYTGVVNVLFGLGVPQVNYVTLYRSRIFHSISLTTKGVARHAEILVRARQAGFTLTQEPLGYRPRTQGHASGSRPSVIAKTLWELLKLRASLGRSP